MSIFFGDSHLPDLFVWGGAEFQSMLANEISEKKIQETYGDMFFLFFVFTEGVTELW